MAGTFLGIEGIFHIPSPPPFPLFNRYSNAHPLRILQVITDIDDTVKSSGGLRLLGVALGGIDTQYKRGQYYPGAFQFALELSRFGVPEGRDPARVAVLTARWVLQPSLPPTLSSSLFVRASGDIPLSSTLT